MKRIWHYLVNQFMKATVRNYKKSLQLTTYTYYAIKGKVTEFPADPDWTTAFNIIEPVHLTLETNYYKWKAAGGRKEGDTLNVDQYLLLLIKKITRWDGLVQSYYEKSSHEYKKIFYDGHYPFSNGEIDTRIGSLLALSENLGKYQSLSGIKAEVDTFYLQIKAARETQTDAKSDTKSASGNVEISRRNAMQALYRLLGFFMYKFYNNPVQFISPLFDSSLLRDHNQVVFTGALDPNENEAVLIHTFVADDEMKVKITGTGSVTLHLATSPNGTNSNPITISNIEPKTIIMSEFGITEYGTHRYLTIINNGDTELEYEIELI